MEDHKSFINEKSKEIFEKLNSIELLNGEYSFELNLLNGLSNKFYRVLLVAPKFKDLKVNDICFKIFGAGSALIDRDLEFFIMQKLAETHYGPQVYETDYKTYRVEEYLHGFTTLDLKEKHNLHVIEELKKSFLLYNETGDYSKYKKFIGQPKKELFDFLLNQDTNQNIVTLTVQKLKSLAKVVLAPFALKVREGEQFKNDADVLDHLSRVEQYLNDFENILFEILPERSIIAMSHNDCHPLNVLVNKNMEKIFLIDHEFGCFNLVGVDIANYNIENLFFLGAPSWPFYLVLENDFRKLEGEPFFPRFVDYIDAFGKQFKSKYSDVKDFDDIIDYMKTQNYYWRCLATSSLLWFVWSLIYLDYNKFADKSSYNYFNYAIDRLMEIFFIAKSKIGKENEKFKV